MFFRDGSLSKSLFELELVHIAESSLLLLPMVPTNYNVSYLVLSLLPNVQHFSERLADSAVRFHGPNRVFIIRFNARQNKRLREKASNMLQSVQTS